jgi:hypothetical protein
MNKQYLLILGSPRSGTTLLASLIGSHPDVAMLIEDVNFTIIKLTGKKVAANKLCIPNQIQIYRRAGFSSKIIRKAGLQNIIKIYPNSRFTIIDYLALENSKIIAIIRNGYDVVFSIQKRGEKKFGLSAYRWCKAIETIHYLYNTYTNRVFLLSFENLVNNPEKQLKAITGFLGLSFEKSMLNGYKYNPIYTREIKIDKAKANQYKEKEVDFNLQERYPAVYSKYIELVNICTQDPH